MSDARARRNVEAPSPGDVFNPYGWFNGSWMPEWLERRPDLTPAAKMIYARLGRFLGEDGESAWPRQEVLAEALGMHRNTVGAAIKELVDVELLRATRRGQGQSNVYVFLWHDWMTGEGCASRSTDVVHQEAQGLGDKKHKNRASLSSKTVSEDSQRKTRSRGFAREVQETDAPALGADPVDSPSTDPAEPVTARQATGADRLARRFVKAAEDARLDGNGPVAGRDDLRFHFARLRKAGVSRERCEEMIDEFVANPDRYRRKGVRLVGAFIRAQEPLLETLQSRVTRSEYDTSQNSLRHSR